MDRPGTEEQEHEHPHTWRREFTRRFGAGLLVLLPLGVTVWFLVVLFNAVSGLLRPLVHLLPGELPEFAERLTALALVVLTVYLVGLLAAHYIGVRLLSLTERLVARIPLANTVYSTARNAMDVLSGSQRKTFQRVVLLDYPRQGILALGFVTGTISVDGMPHAKVFVPTTPNPTSGFLEFVPEPELREVNLTIEEAVKLVVSGGIVSPGAVVTSRPTPDKPNPETVSIPAPLSPCP